MNLRKFGWAAAFLFAAGCSGSALQSPADYVDPFIGTGFHGHTYPGATTPFGMVQLSPDTRSGDWDACAGYYYADKTIDGFSHTHLSGTGCADLGDVMLRPTTREVKAADGSYVMTPASFSHDEEEASCGYYAVKLLDEKIRVELTASPRVGVHRYTFEGDGPRQVVIDMMHLLTDENIKQHELHVVSPTEVGGMRCTDGWVNDQYTFFSAAFSQPVVVSHNFDNKQLLLVFAPEVKELTVAVGLSTVSEENARLNRTTEVPALDFEAVRTAARSMWNEALDDIVVEGGTEAERKTFYTAQYHTKVTPNVMNDVNGDYRRNDGTVARLAEGKKYYSTMSIWDTFRAWHPLQTLVDAEFVNNMVNDMLDMYDATGELPIWPLSSGETRCMIGYHSVSVIADAYMKGIRGFDAERALEAMVRSSNINHKGSDYYVKYGFIPANIKRESVSCLLEYAYDDWAIARMAEAMGRQEIADEYMRRAQNYVNVFDGSTKFFRGRQLDGNWTTPFVDWKAGRDYTEASPWQYRFFVPHDINGLIQLLGSRENFVEALDLLFTKETPSEDLGLVDITGVLGQYAHGNEPSHHMAYLYNWVGQPWKTQEMTRRLLDEMYAPTPEGVIGNEDCGQMSAWYVLSSMGLYSVCPGSNQFILTSPLFEKATVKLTNGKTLVISSNASARNRYIESVTFNGQPVDRACIDYEQLMQGGELKFVLSSEPVKTWAAGTDAYPYSQTETEVVSVPYTTKNLSLFTESVDVDLNSTTEGAEIRYTLDGSEPDEKSALYTAPVKVEKSLTLKARAFKQGFAPSRTMTVEAEKAEFLKPVAQPAAMKNGVRYDYYEGSCSLVAQIKSKKHVGSGVLPEPSIAGARQADYFAFIFEGLLYVPETGIWSFMTNSDNGTVLEIGNKVVVNNDGSHPAVTATGRVALKKGYYPYRLSFFEDYGDESMEWGWKAPSADDYQPIPATNLYLR